MFKPKNAMLIVLSEHISIKPIIFVTCVVIPVRAALMPVTANPVIP